MHVVVLHLAPVLQHVREVRPEPRHGISGQRGSDWAVFFRENFGVYQPPLPRDGSSLPAGNFERPEFPGCIKNDTRMEKYSSSI